MFRRVVAGLILGPALLIGSLAWWGNLVLRTVLDENRTEQVAEELLDNEAVVEQIEANIGRALESALPESVQLSDEQTEAGASIILDDPAVRSLIVDSLATTHRAFLGLDDAPATVDLGPALASSRERIGAVAPAVADALPDAFVVELPTEHIPDASPVKDLLERAVPLLAGISVCMVLLAFLTTSDRSTVLRRAARWAIGTTAVYLVVGLGIPALLRRFAPDQWEVVAALLTAVLRAALIPSVVLGSAGAVLFALSIFWPDRGRAPRRSAARSEAVPVAPRPARARSTPPPRPQTAPAPAPTPPSVTAPTPVTPRAVPTESPAPPPEPPMTTSPAPVPAGDPVTRRPPLPTRARPGDEIVGGPPRVDGADPTVALHEADARGGARPRWLPPTWVEGHGWVMDPTDPREPPSNARFVEGVGWVVPGPPPDTAG